LVFFCIWFVAIEARNSYKVIFLLYLQLTQADVKHFFESICGEVCSFFVELGL
jgi:hypothetical protein